MKKNKRGQIGIEYLIIMGFILLTVLGLMALGFSYMGNIQDGIVMSQVSSLAEKIITTSEKVFYEGEPSKATIGVYIPKEVTEIQIIENSLLISTSTNTGLTKIAYSSNVPIKGNIDVDGSRKIQIVAQENEINITQI